MVELPQGLPGGDRLRPVAALVLQKSVHRVTISCGQEAFFEGHVHAFAMRGAQQHTTAPS